jgi:hypothetical protein
MKIATVINYCTNDYRFLRYCIAEAKQFSRQIVIPVCTHFFNGEPENRSLLNLSYQQHPDVQFVEFEYEQQPYGIYSPLTPSDEDWSHYLHSTARYVGFHYVKECDYVLFLDVDEIVEAERFLKWLEHFNVPDFDALRFSSYFYFREPSNRAIDPFPLNALLVKKQAITSPEIILDVLERKGLYDQIQGHKRSHLVGLDQKPLVHHYSWVRTPEELRQKVRTWGHRHDQEWLKLIDDELAMPFTGIDKVHGFQYEKVEPLHDVLQEIPYPEGLQKTFHHVKKVNRQGIFNCGLGNLLI